MSCNGVDAVNKDIAINIENLSKIYKMYSNPLERMKEALNPFHKRYSRDFYALHDVSITIKKGDTVGFIGKNGAGKSTLLKVITGVLTPTSGNIEVNGRIASLLELGAGFNPEMTGIENIYMNGMLMGYSHSAMDERVDDILAFADIGDFIYQPVKTYSSGMFARVAFAVNAFVSPDILIVDEALSVGDMFFQSKCIDRMKHMLEDGVTVLFVSHDLFAVKSLCKRGIFLDKGKVIKDTDVSEAVEEYRKEQLTEQKSRNGSKPVVDNSQIHRNKWFVNNETFLKNAEYQRVKNGKAQFCNIQLLNEDEEVITEVKFGQVVILRMAILVNQDIAYLGTGYHIRNSSGIDLVYGDSKLDNKIIKNAKAGEQFIMDWKFTMNLRKGSYNFACVMSIPVDMTINKVDCCDFIPCAVQFEQIPDNIDNHMGGGYVHWDNEVNIEKA